jgi:hypothetical protein
MPLQATSGAASYDAFGGGVPVVPAYIEEVFSCFLYTGNVTPLNITNGIDLAGKGGLIWTKERNNTATHLLIDSQRGLANGFLESNTTDAADTSRVSESISSFNADGYTLHAPDTLWDRGSYNYVSWTFRKQPKFFDVVTYTGNGAASRNIAHSLGSDPGCIIVKRTSAANDWSVYHRSTGTGKRLILNDTLAVLTDADMFASVTSTTFSVSGNTDLNDNGATYVAYLFAHNAGGFGLTGTDNVISCGSYTEGASAQNINLGYEPQWLLMKKSSGSGAWYLFDTMRGMSQTNLFYVEANQNFAESSFGAGYIKPTATGFTAEPGFFSNGSNIIYIAIRRGPMRVPTSGTSVYNAIARTGTGTTTSVTGVGFPPDMALIQRRNGGGDSTIYDKLRGPNILLYPQYTLQEFSVSSYLNSFDQDGETLGTNTPNISGETFINWNFRRAPSVFDIVCYTGTGGASQTFTHNLGVVPELVIVKNRSAAAAWESLGTALSASQRQLYLNRTQAGVAVSSGHLGWNGTDGAYKAPTSSVVYFGGDSDVGGSGNTYVAYLFATCAGVSKVGSYTGTGTTLQIDCGFTAGARFVLIKRTDSTGDWYVWDSTRGIVSGNDPYLVLNNGVAEVTSTDYIDTYSAGFEISSTAPAAINASAGTFVFLAIA